MEIHTLVDGRYFLHSRLHKGELVSSYLIWHNLCEVHLIAKISNKSRDEAPGEWSRMHREAQQWVELGIHPNVVAGYFLREIEGKLWLFLEPASGKSLVEFSVGGDLSEILTIALEVANGMAYLHGEGIVHGNLRMGSVIRSTDGRIRLRDIRWDYWDGLKMLAKGLRCPAYPRFDSQTLKKQANARLAYRPPEYFSDPAEKIDTAFDVYSFGVLLYELWTGHPPVWYPEEDIDNLFFAYARGYQNYNTESLPWDSLPSILSPLIRSCLEKDPHRRPGSFTQIVEALEEIYEKTTRSPYRFEDWDENTLLAMSLNNRALARIDSGELEKAERLLQEVSELDTRRVTARLNLNLVKLRGRKLSISGFFDKTEKFKYLDPVNVSLLQGQAVLESGSMVSETLGKLEDVPTNEALSLLRANFHYRLHHYQEARDGFRTCANTGQGRQDLWYRLGSASLALKLYEEAQQAWEFGMRQPLPLWELVMAYSMLLAVKGQWARARRCLDLAVSELDHYLQLPVSGSQWSQVAQMKVGEPILAVSMSEKEEFIFAWTQKGRCRIWHWPSGKEEDASEIVGDLSAQIAGKFRLKSMPARMSGVSVAGDTARAITLHGDNLVRVWNLQKGERIYEMAGHSAPVTAAAIGVKGKIAISGSMDRAIKLWDLVRGQCMTTLTGHTDCVNCVALSRDCSIAISGGWDKTVRVWDLLNRSAFTTLEGHGAEITALGISPDGKVAISADAASTIRLWDISQKNNLAVLEGSQRITSVYVSDAGHLAVSGSEDGCVCVYEDVSRRPCPCWCKANYLLDTLPPPVPLKERQKNVAQENGIRELLKQDQVLPAWQEYRKKGEAGDVDLLQDLSAGAAKEGLSPQKLQSVAPFTGFVGESDIVAFACAGGDSLFMMEKNGVFRRWHWRHGHSDTFWHKPALGQKAMSYHAGGTSVFAFSGEARMLYLWWPDSDTWATMEGHSGEISAIRITREGDYAIIGNTAGIAQIWELARQRLIAEWKAHSQMITDIAIAGQLAVTASVDGTMRCWDIESRTGTVQGQKKVAPILCTGVQGDGLISGSIDGTLRQWNIHNGIPHNVVKAHETAITALDVQGDIIALGGQDGALKLWSIARHKCLAALPTHNAPIIQVRLDGIRLFSSAKDNTLKVHLLEWSWEH